MGYVFVILFIFIFAAIWQLYLSTTQTFRQKSKHLATRDKFNRGSGAKPI